MSCCGAGNHGAVTGAHLTALDPAQVKEAVRSLYAASAERVRSSGAGEDGCGCGCGPGGAVVDPATSGPYGEADRAVLPVKAVVVSLGCGNPTALAELKEGEVVLDLGSGGGIDVLLSARRVGPSGKAYGLDMTPEMLELARENQREAGIENAEFLQGDMEDLPLPDAAVDVVISNCVINLATDKGRVLSEAFRVLRPGGRLAVYDVLFQGGAPRALRRSRELWAGCVAGALEEGEFRRLLEEVGFVDVEIDPTHVHDLGDLSAWSEWVDPMDASWLQAGGRLVSAFVRGEKPEAPVR